MVSSHQETKKANGEHRVNHTQCSEYRFARESLHNVANDTKPRQNKDVDLRMAKESE
jgi:hypothetical protein